MKKQLLLLFALFFCFSFSIQSQIITTIAGNGIGSFSGDGGLAISSELHGPYGMCFDTSGNLYIADALNHRVRKISPSGIITTFAGTGASGYSGDGGNATLAKLYRPTGVVSNSNGDIFICDELNHCIRKVNSSGIISTYAGIGSSAGNTGDGSLATSAQLNSPNRIAIDSVGNIYIPEYASNVIRKVDASSGIITTIAGTGIAGFSGDGGLAINATLNSPCQVSIDRNGNLFFADEFNNRIRKINTFGIITTVAGNGVAAYSGNGSSATSASINIPEGVTVDGSGNLFICDKGNEVIRKVNTSGIISTIAGTGTQGYSGDGGVASLAKIYYPEEIVFDPSGNLYFSDWGNNAIRKISNVITGIKENNSDIDQLILFPNPTNGILSIKINAISEHTTFMIFDSMGKLVKSGDLFLSEQINIQALTDGIYNVIINSSGKLSSSKISLQR